MVGGVSNNAVNMANKVAQKPDIAAQNAPDKTGQVKGSVEASPQAQAMSRQQAQNSEMETRAAMDSKTSQSSGKETASRGLGGMSFEKMMAMVPAKEQEAMAKDAMAEAKKAAAGGGGGGGAAGGAGGAAGGAGAAAQSTPKAQASPKASEQTKAETGVTQPTQNMFPSSGNLGSALNQMANSPMKTIQNIRQ